MKCYICDREIDPNNHGDFYEMKMHLEQHPAPHRYDYDRIITDYICPNCIPKIKKLLVHERNENKTNRKED